MSVNKVYHINDISLMFLLKLQFVIYMHIQIGYLIINNNFELLREINTKWLNVFLNEKYFDYYDMYKFTMYKYKEYFQSDSQIKLRAQKIYKPYINELINVINKTIERLIMIIL